MTLSAPCSLVTKYVPLKKQIPVVKPSLVYCNNGNMVCTCSSKFSKQMQYKCSDGKGAKHLSQACKLAASEYHFHSPTQLSQRLQWEARGGLKILQVKQYFSLTVWPLITTSFVLGGGL